MQPPQALGALIGSDFKSLWDCFCYLHLSAGPQVEVHDNIYGGKILKNVSWKLEINANLCNKAEPETETSAETF